MKADVSSFGSFAFVGDGLIANGTEQVVTTDAYGLDQSKN